MEKNFYETIELMEIRPAKFNGSEIDYVPVIFNKNSMFKVEVEDADYLDMVPGDTVEIHGKVISDEAENDFAYITLYMDGEVLSKFISKLGFLRVSGMLRMKLKLVHVVIKPDLIIETKREITGYKVLEIYDDEA